MGGDPPALNVRRLINMETTLGLSAVFTQSKQYGGRLLKNTNFYEESGE